MVDGDPMEGDGCEREEERHAPHGREQDAAAPEAVHHHEVDPGEEEVGRCDDGADCDGVGESDEGEEGRGVVHKTVEAAELADGHKTAGGDEGAEVSRDDVELLEEPEAAFAFLESLGFGDVGGDVSDFLLHLLGSSFRENLLDDNGCCFGLVVVDELTR